MHQLKDIVSRNKFNIQWEQKLQYRKHAEQIIVFIGKIYKFKFQSQNSIKPGVH